MVAAHLEQPCIRKAQPTRLDAVGTTSSSAQQAVEFAEVLSLCLLQGLTARMTPGYAIGGLAGGEEKTLFVKVVAQVMTPSSCHELLLTNGKHSSSGDGLSNLCEMRGVEKHLSGHRRRRLMRW